MKIRLMVVLAMLGLLLTAGGIAQANPTEQTTALTRVRLVSGSASGQDFGDTFSKVQTVGIGPGYRAVNVQLAGWSLRYASDDHHLRTASVRISNVQYNASTGNVTFTISGAYRDKNGDDDFVWAVDYTILALG
jgi:hypothetical protein